MEAASVRQQVRRVLIITLVLNVVVALGKIVIGAISGVLAISADGVHSLIDGASNIVALIANRVANKPPDEDHPYGHRRYETLAALGIGAMLLLTAWEIVNSAIERLQSGETPEITLLTLLVPAVTLVVNIFVSRYERREGKRLKSELLLADAENTGADVFVTISVLLSTIAVGLFGWSWLDAVAALVVVALIAHAGWKVLRQTGRVLVDTAPYPPRELAALAETVPGVREVVRVRSRGSVDAGHVDVDVRVAPETTADHTAAIATAIRQRLEDNFNGVQEVEVHFMPDNDGPTDYALAARAHADALGLQTHEVRLSDGPDGRLLEMHVEVPANQSLAAAHEQVTQLEQDVRASLPDVDQVVTHIEPSLIATTEDIDDPATAEGLRGEAADLLHRSYPDGEWHDLRVTRYEDGYALAAHTVLPAETTVEAAHDRAEAAEMLLRSRLGQLRRVTIHTEPPEEASQHL
jgi:cation diffusion facilitator family transporter